MYVGFKVVELGEVTWGMGEETPKLRLGCRPHLEV